jgi:hypothetical protein
MRRFILRLGAFLVLGFGVLNLTAIAIMSCNNPFANRLSWFDLHRRVMASRTPINADVVILGDSVAGQFFPFGEHPSNLTSNGSILMIGHYVLAANVLDNSPAVNRVVLISAPHVIGSTFERPKTFHNMVLPFWKPSHLKHFTPLARSKILSKPVAAAYLLPGVKLLPLSDIDYSAPSKPRQDVLSDIAVEYLCRLTSLCDRHNVELRIVSPPLRARLQDLSHDWLAMRRQIRDEGLERTFDGYFRSIVYLPKDRFRDRVHLSEHAVRQHRQMILELAGIVGPEAPERREPTPPDSR